MGMIVQQMTTEPCACKIFYRYKRYYAEFDYMQL